MFSSIIGITAYAELEAHWPLFVCYPLLFIVLCNCLVLMFIVVLFGQ
jgi:hypothetical protein